MIRLSDATLSDLPESIARPTYDRSALTPGIVHIGLGNFHRAHQSWYLHRLLQLGSTTTGRSSAPASVHTTQRSVRSS